MAPKSLLLATLGLVAAALVSAQTAPSYQEIPKACATDCSKTIEASYLCEKQYTNTTDIFACFCTALPSDLSTCSSCLNTNNAAALSQLVSSASTACPTALTKCAFECNITACAKEDTACQCSGSYLEAIFNCATCNTANGNTGSTGIADFQALNTSCANQKYSGPSMSFTTIPLASPTGQNNYVAPSLTATGGGAAASGSSSVKLSASSSIALASGSVSRSASSGSSAASSSRASSASGSGSASRSASSVSAAAASASTSVAAGSSNVVPAVGGILALVGGLAALL